MLKRKEVGIYMLKRYKVYLDDHNQYRVFDKQTGNFVGRAYKRREDAQQEVDRKNG